MYVPSAEWRTQHKELLSRKCDTVQIFRDSNTNQNYVDKDIREN